MSNDAASPRLPAVATAVTTVLPGVLRWAVYSPAHKVELCSHSVRLPNVRGTGLVFDPIPLTPEIWDWFPPEGPPEALILTNENHERHAAAWRDLFPVPVWAAAGAKLTRPGIRRWDARLPVPVPAPVPGWTLIPLPGGAPGETAWHCPAQSLMVFGDAVVNLEGRGLERLPDHYCTNPAQLRDSLRSLRGISFEYALLAHGTPLIGSAAARIAGLL